ncbi:tRNA ligase [Aspergillus pseudotamarii]|uniref:tRNA ligase n=1 Tax=Aspergillus pseudotamarii TaxID=132259 RepID=A0A5N6SWA5_ASPPS|nr:tRNA ligase [Aspergillus pseudotamarii]KAE8138966.1 tRNA ligase [Aspergillus pseudotamarii]
MSSSKGDQKDLSDQVVYFSLRLSSPVAFASAVDRAFADADSDEAQFYRYLKQNNRIQSEFHVTLIHVNDRTTHPEIWEKYKAKFKDTLSRENSGDGTSTLGSGEVLADQVVWDQGIMALAVRATGGDGEPLPCANANAHITIGTANDSIKAFESNDLLQRWKEGDQSKGSIRCKEFPKGCTFEGSVRANFAG